MRYSWHRYWCPPEGSYSLQDGGYLVDPSSQYGALAHSGVVSFADINGKQCLVLLGEPGIGKTYEITAAYERVRCACAGTPDEVLFFNLREFQTDARLCEKVFQNDIVDRWRSSRSNLHLFLDALDESLLRIDNVATVLMGELRDLPHERLFLRISSRTAEFPNSFKIALQRLFDEEDEERVGVYELVPLTKQDVRAAAVAEGLNADAFLGAVDRGEAQPLAIKPVTLRMLVKLFKRDGHFPSRKVELYTEGCLELCREPNPERRDSAPIVIVRYSEGALFAVACRIAAVTVFSNRDAVWCDTAGVDVPPEDVPVAALCGGTERAGQDDIPISDGIVWEALKTGLFSARGTHRMGWAHQTYAEFLAARYLLVNDVTPEDALKLLRCPGDKDRRVVPQLREAAAWTASMYPEVLRRLQASDPEVLLFADAGAVDERNRRRLVRNLLEGHRQEQQSSDTTRYSRTLAKLAHPGLAKQLRPWIRSKKKGFTARCVAIDIAEQCKQRDLLDDLVEVCLNEADELVVRKRAGYAITRIGDSNTKAKLRPLAMGEAGNDPRDDLKGIGLRALWPDHMTAEELFGLLTPPKRSNYFGDYSEFLFELRKRELIGQLTPDDLTFALNWIADGTTEGFELSEIRHSVLLRSWDCLSENPDLAAPFARAVIYLLSVHYRLLDSMDEESSFEAMVRNDDDRRRLVLAAMVEALEGNRKDLRLLRWNTPFSCGKDLEWIIEQASSCPVEQQRLWAKAAMASFNWSIPVHVGLILQAREELPSFADEFDFPLAVEIDSKEGRAAKAEYLRKLRRERRQEARKHRPPVSPPPLERVTELLREFEAGDKDAWWQLIRAMAFEPDGSYVHKHLNYEWDITSLPVWSAANQELHDRLISAAKAYACAPPSSARDTAWLKEGTLYKPAMAGYKGLALLQHSCPEAFNGIPAEAWHVWAPIAVAYPLGGDDEPDSPPHSEIIQRAYAIAPDRLKGTLLTMIDAQEAKSGLFDCFERAAPCWDEGIAGCLLDKAQDSSLRPESAGRLLAFLISRRHSPSVEIALSLIRLTVPTDAAPRKRVLIAGKALLEHCPEVAWGDVWRAVVSDEAFGRELFESFAHMPARDDVQRLVERIGDKCVADLYMWLIKQYPHEEDPQHDGAYFAGPRESVGRFRDGLLGHLRDRGTPEGCIQIERIARRLPQHKWLKQVLVRAKEATRRKTWEPPTPERIRKIVKDKGRALIEGCVLLMLILFLADVLRSITIGAGIGNILLLLLLGSIFTVMSVVGVNLSKKWLCRHRQALLYVVLVMFDVTIAILLLRQLTD